MIWKIVAFIVSRRAIADWLIRRAQRTPYFHLPGYMSRWWLFNPYGGGSQGEADQADDSARHLRRWPWLPSVRIHHILREDLADHPHDHPWDARTIILKGWYVERKHGRSAGYSLVVPRLRGDTAPIKHGAYHHIASVSPGGVWTLFITWDYRGSWGFLVDGQKVSWREYEATHARHSEVPVFANMGDSEAEFIADGERLDCPTCGGSGHAGDAKASTLPAWPAENLNPKKTLDVLTKHNRWRRGAYGPQTDPRLLGLALDAAVAYIGATQKEAE